MIFAVAYISFQDCRCNVKRIILSYFLEAEYVFILVFYLAQCGSSNTGCCTSTNLCAYGQGYCSTNADCQGNLICDSGSTNTCGK